MFDGLAPKSRDTYERLLSRAFGGSAPPFDQSKLHLVQTTWPDSCRVLLRAAVRRALSESNAPEGVFEGIAKMIAPKGPQRSRVPRIPTEDEIVRYVSAASRLTPERRALALLPLTIGLRAEELLALSRAQCERAARYGELIVVRKGGDEQTLPVEHAKALFEVLLLAPKSAGRFDTRRTSTPKPPPWNRVGEILSPGKLITQYHALHRLVLSTGQAAGLRKLRPHLLRHAFATRMNRDGAPIATIAWMLGHRQLATVQRYVHPAAEDAKRFMRPV